MSSMRLINETSGSSVATLQLNDVFSSDYDVYQIQIPNGVSTGTANWSRFEMVNTSGNKVQTASYDYSMNTLYSYTGITESRNVNDASIPYVFYNTANLTDGAGAYIWLFNPYKSKYTWLLFSSAGFVSGSGTIGTKGIGVVKTTDVYKGFAITRLSGSFDDITVQVYGLRES